MVKESAHASELTWEDGRVFVPPEVECKWHRNDDGTPTRPDQHSGFWIYQDDLKYAHPAEIDEDTVAYLSKNSFYDDSEWEVRPYTPRECKTANENLQPSDPESEELKEIPKDILGMLRERTAKLSYEATLATTPLSD
jgi:hypothetical protein